MFFCCAESRERDVLTSRGKVNCSRPREDRLKWTKIFLFCERKKQFFVCSISRDVSGENLLVRRDVPGEPPSTDQR